jgi:chromosome segregation ATPase
MAQKKSSGQRKTLPRAASPASTAARGEAQTVDALRAECERLKAELTQSRAEIADLRERQSQVLNRIDWVLDSLDSLPKQDT